MALEAANGRLHSNTDQDYIDYINRMLREGMEQQMATTSTRTRAERFAPLSAANQTPEPPSMASALPATDHQVDSTPAVLATSNLNYQTKRHLIVVGAGGSGARVISPLSQILSDGDHLTIIDDDVVEERNLRRQMFAPGDVGMHKALITATRYRRNGITTASYTTRLAKATNQGFVATMDSDLRNSPSWSALSRHGNSFPATIIIGCVDNWKARVAIQNMAEVIYRLQHTMGVAYIDIGNETRGGQVLMNLIGWPLVVKLLKSGGNGTGNWSLNAFTAMPQLLSQAPWSCATCGVDNTAELCSKCGRDEDSCADRVDLQTVMVNNMAAACALNCVATLISGIPFTNAGAFFSTLNSMSPIRLAGATGGALLPETTYAISPAKA